MIRHAWPRDWEAAKADYRAQGFVILSGLYTPAMLAGFAAALTRIEETAEALAARHEGKLVFERDLPAHRRDGIADVGAALFLVNDLALFAASFRPFHETSGLKRIFSDLLGLDQPTLHYTNATIKQARFGRAIAWHRDFPNRYICPPDGRYLRLMLCLDGMTDESGATMFYPGSQCEDAADDVAAYMAAHSGRPVAAVCAPGDVVLIHPRVIHGGGMNHAARPRRNLILQAGSPVPAEQPHEQFTGQGLG